MRILLAGLYVPTGKRHFGGVQSWIWTVRRELERLGHDCEEWEPDMELPEGRFDLGIITNQQVTRPVFALCERVVYVCHGVVETDVPLPGAVFVSEGTRAKWPGFDGPIVRQPIDLDYWSPDPAVQRRGAIRYSYRRAPTHCAAACEALGIPFRESGTIRRDEARRALQSAEIVFATGRAALEAMACGAKVVIYDHRKSYQGPLLALDIEADMAENYSGRSGFEPTLDDVIVAVRTARPSRGWVEKHHDARKIVQELLSHA